MYGSRLLSGFEGVILEQMSDKLTDDILESTYAKKEKIVDIKEDLNNLDKNADYEF